MIALAKTKPKGISDKDISAEMPDLEPSQKAQVVNKLLSRGYINLFKQGGSLLYRLKDPNKGKAVMGADNEEKIVYSIIEDAGNKGIWIRDIRFKSNLMLTQLNKILKNLETKKLIKAVKSVAASKKKVYMLYNLEPDRTITGGAWYQDQDFEAEFVDVLNQQCFRFLDKKREDNKDSRLGPIDARNSTFASSKEVWKFISDLGISKVNFSYETFLTAFENFLSSFYCFQVKLSVEDLEMILNTLVYDGKVEKILSSDGNNLYRALQPLLSPPGLIKTPCGVCPVKMFFF